MAREKDCIADIFASTKKVVCFVDFDNMLDHLTCEAVQFLMDKLIEIGKVEHAVFYTDVWHAGSGNKKGIDILNCAPEFGFKITHCPKLNSGEKQKDTVDENILDDIYRLLGCRHDIDVFVLVAQDSNFMRIMNTLKQFGKKVVLVVDKQSGNRRLEQIAHQVIKLDFSTEAPEIKMPKSLKDLLDIGSESPQSLISTIAEKGLADSHELKTALDIVIAIDSMKSGEYPFQYHLDWLQGNCKFIISRKVFDEVLVRGILSVFIDCNILERVKEATRKYYVLNRTHVFAQVALNPGHLENLKALFQD